jgi:hypothetical protein
MSTTETMPLGEEIMALSATRLGWEQWRPPDQHKSLRELVAEHAAVNGYSGETVGELGQSLLAALGGEVISLYFQNKEAKERENQLASARQQAAEEARDRLFEISDTYRGARLKVVSPDDYSTAIFRQLNTDYLNPRGKNYKEVVGKINRRSFISAHNMNLTMPGLLKRLDGTNDLRVQLFRNGSITPAVKLELVG